MIWVTLTASPPTLRVKSATSGVVATTLIVPLFVAVAVSVSEPQPAVAPIVAIARTVPSIRMDRVTTAPCSSDERNGSHLQ